MMGDTDVEGRIIFWNFTLKKGACQKGGKGSSLES